MMLSVGFLSAFDTTAPPSVTNRLSTSQDWQTELSTEVDGASPVIPPPTSYILSPGAAITVGEVAGNKEPGFFPHNHEL